LVGLDELPRPALNVATAPILGEGKKVTIALAPRKIVTLRIEPA
jgi:hypothetical protein